jgi:hypothetical protein
MRTAAWALIAQVAFNLLLLPAAAIVASPFRSATSIACTAGRAESGQSDPSAGSGGPVGRNMKTTTRVMCVWGFAGLLASSAGAQSGPAAPQPQGMAPAAVPATESSAPAKRLTVTTGVDFTSAYLFRGIPQHSGGTIAQPYADLGIALGNGISANVGGWNSVHSTASAGNWYEADYYGSVTFTAGKVKPGVLYTSYTSPADSFATVKELAGVVAFDDSGSPFPLSPKVVLAFELGAGEADGGASKGTYLELGIRPTVKLAPKATLAIPIKTGLSAHHYYEGAAGDNRFGYLDTGLQLSVPVASGNAGALEAHGGIDLYTLGDNLKLLNNGDAFKPVGLIGFTFTY